MIAIPPTRYILPNLFTLGATFCGFSSIWISTHAQTREDLYRAATLIVLGAFLDGFDGRVARMVGGESKFGVQLDSLSDFLTFGAAPAMLVQAWALGDLGIGGFLCSFAFAAAAMLRLARFNVQAEETGGKDRYFVGIPSPLAGVSLAVLVGMNTGVFEKDSVNEAALPSLAVVVLAFAFLMVSNIKFRTFKDARKTKLNRAIMGGILLAQAVISVRFDPMIALGLSVVGYLGVHLPGQILWVTRGARDRIRVGRNGSIAEDADDEVDD